MIFRPRLDRGVIATANEHAAIKAFLRMLRRSRREKVNQFTVVVDHHACYDGVDLFYMPNERGFATRIELGKETKR